VATPRLVEIAYWMIRRETLAGVVEKEVARARERALARIDAQLETAGDDEGSGLPSWVVQSGIGPADGTSPFDF
jgi:hypothetical protein